MDYITHLRNTGRTPLSRPSDPNLVGLKLVRAMTPRPLLHLEGAAILVVSLAAYHSIGAGWLRFALLFLVPDISMLGYAVNVRVGAISYNAVHCYAAPLILAACSLGTNHPAMLS